MSMLKEKWLRCGVRQKHKDFGRVEGVSSLNRFSQIGEAFGMDYVYYEVEAKFHVAAAARVSRTDYVSLVAVRPEIQVWLSAAWSLLKGESSLNYE